MRTFRQHYLLAGISFPKRTIFSITICMWDFSCMVLCFSHLKFYFSFASFLWSNYWWLIVELPLSPFMKFQLFIYLLLVWTIVRLILVNICGYRLYRVLNSWCIMISTLGLMQPLSKTRAHCSMIYTKIKGQCLCIINYIWY